MSKQLPQTFKLVRNIDESGVSGTGHVADGVMFWNGKCVLCWRTECNSVAVYDNMHTLKEIHGHGGKTRVVWNEKGV